MAPYRPVCLVHVFWPRLALKQLGHTFLWMVYWYTDLDFWQNWEKKIKLTFFAIFIFPPLWQFFIKSEKNNVFCRIHKWTNLNFVPIPILNFLFWNLTLKVEELPGLKKFLYRSFPLRLNHEIKKSVVSPEIKIAQKWRYSLRGKTRTNWSYFLGLGISFRIISPIQKEIFEIYLSGLKFTDYQFTIGEK